MYVPPNQRGVILAVTMIMLLLLTIIGLSSMSVATLQERMAGNALDRNYALQAAEATLRHAELRIARELSPASFSAVSEGTCASGGLCKSSDFLHDHPWNAVNWDSGSGNYARYKDFPDLEAGETRFVIEYTPKPGCEPRKGGNRVKEPPAFAKYRVTANAPGRSTTSRVLLQSVYRKRAGTC